MLSPRRSLVLALLSVAPDVYAKDSVFTTIAPTHLGSFPALQKASDSTEIKKTNLQPWKNQTIQGREVQEQIYHLLGHSHLPSTNIFNAEGLTDLELVRSNNVEHREAHVLATFSPRTASGAAYLAYLMNNPTTDIDTLKKRQNVIAFFVNNTDLFNQLDENLILLAASEKDAALLLRDSEATKKLLEVHFFDQKQKALNSSRVWHAGTSATNYFLVGLTHSIYPLYIAYFYRKLNLSLDIVKQLHTQYPAQAATSWAIFAALQALQSYQANTLKQFKLDSVLYMQKLMINVAHLVRVMDLIERESELYPELRHLHSASLIEKYTNQTDTTLTPSMKKLINLLRTNTFKGKESHFSMHGNTKAAYALLLECRTELHELFEIAGEIDAYLTCAKLLKQSESKSVGYTFAEYVENASAPSISATNIWHPLVGPQKSVTNSIELGGENKANIILTGPNAGGKSTLLKGLTINVLFAQSLGIVPAQRFVLTPFAKINTYMNIADDTAGGNSLFKSEVLRAQSLMNTVKNLPAGQFAFSVMDEMFSGTSPKEGEAASYAVAEKLGSLPNSMLLLATHFQKLTELQNNTKNFTNYQVRVQRHENGTFSYPFKLELGKADQNVAIEILQQQGFDTSILDSAHAILGSN